MQRLRKHTPRISQAHLLVALVASITGAVAFGQSGRNQPRYFVLSVGVNHYQDSGWPALQWAERDAELFSAQVGNLDGYQKVIRTLKGKNATRTGILNELRAIQQAAKPRDIVVLYFSTHGTLQPTSTGNLDNTLVTYDTQADELARTALSQNTIRQMANRLRAKRRLIVFATCHSGIGKSVIPEDVRALMVGQKGRIEELDRVSEGAIVLGAASQSEAARESAKLQADIYTHFFLEGLTAGDRNGDGLTTALEAHDFSSARTFAFSGGKQRPTVESAIIGDGDVPLAGAKKNEGNPVLMAYDRRYEGMSLQVNDQIKGRLPVGAAMRPGTNVVMIYAPDRDVPFATFEVNASEGEHFQFDELFRPPPWRVWAGMGVDVWSDPGMEKVFDATTTTSTRIGAEYLWRGYSLGIRYGNSQLDGDSNKSTSLDAELSVQQVSAVLTRLWSLTSPLSRWPLFLGISGLIGQEAATFSLSDGSGAGSRGAESTALHWAIALELRWSVLFAQTAFGAVEHQFGSFGKLSGQRQEFSIGLQHAFGARARRK